MKIKPIQENTVGLQSQGWGKQMHDLMAELFPLHRSMTGNGVRETLRILQRLIPLEVQEVPSGTKVFDWQIPNEWNMHDAWIKDSNGCRVVDYRESNLHVVAYSQPINRTMTLSELEPHLHSIPNHPDWIPYRSAPFEETWGFCLSHRQLEKLRSQGPNAKYEVCINAELQLGALTYGELFLPGQTTNEVLFSTHICHPSLANDNLSGIAVATFLARELAKTPHRLSYRFIFAPATMGSIAWLASHQDHIHRVQHGLVLTNLGDGGQFTYKQSRRGDAPIDHAMPQVLKELTPGFQVRPFSPFGYDERQYCSCGFNLPLGRISRTPEGEYPEYHSSADDLDLVRPQYLQESLECCLAVAKLLESNRNYQNTHPFCEPPLSSLGLYTAYGMSDVCRVERQRAVQWILNQSDGNHSLLDIAARSGIAYEKIQAATEQLIECGLLKEC